MRNKFNFTLLKNINIIIINIIIINCTPSSNLKDSDISEDTSQSFINNQIKNKQKEDQEKLLLEEQRRLKLKKIKEQNDLKKRQLKLQENEKIKQAKLEEEENRLKQKQLELDKAKKTKGNIDFKQKQFHQKETEKNIEITNLKRQNEELNKVVNDNYIHLSLKTRNQYKTSFNKIKIENKNKNSLQFLEKENDLLKTFIHRYIDPLKKGLAKINNAFYLPRKSFDEKVSEIYGMGRNFSDLLNKELKYLTEIPIKKDFSNFLSKINDENKDNKEFKHIVPFIDQPPKKQKVQQLPYQGYLRIIEEKSNGIIYIYFPGTGDYVDTKIDADLKKLNIKELGGQFHRSFYNLVKRISPQINPFVEQALKDYKDKLKIVINGHSLGAACSLIYALSLVKLKKIDPNKISVLLFGVPPCMDKKAAKEYNKTLGKRTLSINDRQDIVHKANLPFKKFYKKFGYELETYDNKKQRHFIGDYMDILNRMNNNPDELFKFKDYHNKYIWDESVNKIIKTDEIFNE